MSLFIVRKKLTPDEITPPNIRYDADCDCFQTTYDGGTTWVDNPAADPRYAPQYQAPAPTGGDPQCDGAARMVALLKDSNDASIHAVSAVQSYSALYAVVAIIFSFGVGLLVSLLIALADLIFSVGTMVVDDAFTSDVYDQIECITYCRLNAGGQFQDQAAWDAYQDEIGATFGLSVVTTVLARMFLSFGFVTLNNAASLRTETGDCTDCDCSWCVRWDVDSWDGLYASTDVAYLQANTGDPAVESAAVVPPNGDPFTGSGYADGHHPIAAIIDLGAPVHVIAYAFQTEGLVGELLYSFDQVDWMGMIGTADSYTPIDVTARYWQWFVYGAHGLGFVYGQLWGDGDNPLPDQQACKA